MENAGKETQIEKGDKYIALTFEDGPHLEVTPLILASLAECDAKSTFFHALITS